MDLRPSRLSDPHALELIARVQAEYVERYGGEDEAPIRYDEFDAPAGAFFIGYADLGAGPVPVAMGGWRRASTQALGGREVAEIKRMFVDAAARRRGYAAAVLRHLEQTAAEAGIDVLVLETGLRQPEAMALYEAHGYVPIPGYGYYRDAPLSRCYAKKLAKS
ncbi:GNAT family N-acetyltransferase [Nocardioides massiliensis]|uniref:GNAT superfamily N-acetyltransferase n=1 Tax=Nocardioides massiliensis TaxID=1325935 RepID=A0ABT9NP21_9ACTN|nr:GNAT family N-acetyltransferase [Nocardioides massiliensis]MDP9822156.1 GNAT superfamily N-acetyltransferase [Nocardioides massiliensis]